MGGGGGSSNLYASAGQSAPYEDPWSMIPSYVRPDPTTQETTGMLMRQLYDRTPEMREYRLRHGEKQFSPKPVPIFEGPSGRYFDPMYGNQDLQLLALNDALRRLGVA